MFPRAVSEVDAGGRGTIQLAEAQREIATDWLAVFKGRGLQPAQ
jgi:hypothetical protein